MVTSCSSRWSMLRSTMQSALECGQFLRRRASDAGPEIYWSGSLSRLIATWVMSRPLWKNLSPTSLTPSRRLISVSIGYLIQPRPPLFWGNDQLWLIGLDRAVYTRIFHTLAKFAKEWSDCSAHMNKHALFHIRVYLIYFFVSVKRTISCSCAIYLWSKSADFLPAL